MDDTAPKIEPMFKRVAVVKICNALIANVFLPPRSKIISVSIPTGFPGDCIALVVEHPGLKPVDVLHEEVPERGVIVKEKQRGIYRKTWEDAQDAN